MDWYEAIVWSYEYDALNRTVASNMVNSDKAGNVLNTTDITYEYADEGTWNYTLVQRSNTVFLVCVSLSCPRTIQAASTGMPVTALTPRASHSLWL